MSEALYEQRPLGDAVERHIGGGTPPRQVPSYWKGEIPWASVKDFSEQKGVIQDTEEHISSAGLHASASNLIPEKMPLVCTRMAVGRAALPVVPMAINQDVKALFPASGVSAEYLLKLMQYIQPLAEGRAVGSTVKGIRIQDYLNIPVPLAPQEAQPVIAQILDTLDTAIRETEALIDKLKAVKQGLLHDLLTRGIDANGQLRPPQSEAPQLYKESPLGWIPMEWDVQSLDNITATPICYGIVQVLDYVPSGIPVLAIRDLLGDYVTGIHRTASSIDAAYPRSRVNPGDVLLSIKGTIGRIGVVPPHFFGNISRDIALIRPTSAIRPQFLAQMLRSPIGQSIIKQAQVGTTRAEISIAPLRKLEIAFPDVREQVRIEEILGSADIRLADEQAKLDKLKSQKTGLMDDLLTGRVRVTPLLEGAAAP